jgi:UrcA family protein
MLKTIITTALLAASVSVAAPAAAQPERVTRQVSVQYADLDLRRAADVREFDRRLRSAVSAVCADEDGSLRATDLDKLHCRYDALRRLHGKREAAISSAKGEARLALNASTR